MPVPRPPSALIAGSGIVGAAVAYFLAQRGVSVQVVDAEAPAAQASGSADGAVSVASKRPGPLMTAALAGAELYRQLSADGLFADLYKTRSTYIVATSDAECEVLTAHSAALSWAGVRVRELTGGGLRTELPVLSPATRMAIEVHDEGHAIGYRVVHRLLTASGVEVRRGTAVERLIIDPGGRRVVGVQTSRGPLHADVVILATGNGTADLLGLRDILVPRKGQLLITERAPSLNAALPGALMSGRYLLSKGSHTGGASTPSRGIGLVIDPLRTGQFLIGGTREDHADKRTNDLDAVSRILSDALVLLPALADIRLLRTFAGARTAVADGLPLVGRLPGLDNAFIATGFEGDGICLGPIIGKAVGQLVKGETPDIDLSAFDPARFSACRVPA
ncbi:NAD(P)/FAD-dependent oxidoreductase [Polymorphum gilvum]|uniref:FAD dependent oxidoreductase n=1 Tax=Polymorphum gilvum (strain LMG 25793 / CGMCC 1.9160 / SL003B-26A1) TaxID=991905 RepID=F2IWZ7_POLGS|nr:FAD-binding oxidoreductase [Polymorphum gilvum]ADZ71574.1 FAD dependent oxidoreductase [Polymorphum gilvum SL003B-26A1]